MTMPRHQYAEKRNEGGAYREEKERGKQKEERRDSAELLNGFPVSRRCNALLSLGS